MEIVDGDLVPTPDPYHGKLAGMDFHADDLDTDAGDGGGFAVAEEKSRLPERGHALRPGTLRVATRRHGGGQSPAELRDRTRR
jgi:hypothetical protein